MPMFVDVRGDGKRSNDHDHASCNPLIYQMVRAKLTMTIMMIMYENHYIILSTKDMVILIKVITQK